MNFQNHWLAPLMALCLMFPFSLFAGDFLESDPSKDAKYRQAFYDWLFSVDLTEETSSFEEVFQFMRDNNLPINNLGDIDSAHAQFFDSETDRRVSLTFGLGFSRAPEGPFVSNKTPRSVRINKRFSYGQAVGHNQIQVISEVPGTSRRKFLLIEGVGGEGSPKLVVPHQKTCISCHQNGAEHLTAGPWLDTTQNSQVRKNILPQFSKWIEENGYEHPLNPFQSEVINFDQARFTPEEKNLGFVDPFQGNNNNMTTLDSEVRDVSRRLQGQRVCETLCEGDVPCRRALLISSIFNSFFVDPAVAEFVEKHLRPKWPEHMFSQPSSVLPTFEYSNPDFPQGVTSLYKFSDIDVAFDELFQDIEDESWKKDFLLTPYAAGFLESIASNSFLRVGNGVDTVMVEGSPGMGPGAISRKRPLVGWLRPQDLIGHRGLADSCFQMNAFKMTSEQFPSVSSRTLFTVLSSSQWIEDEFFNNQWPISGESITQEIKSGILKLSQSAANELSQCPEYLQSADGQAVADYLGQLRADSVKIFSKDQVKTTLRETCSSCHTKDSGTFVGIDLPLEEIEKLSSYKNSLAQKRIECGEMPALGALRNLSIEERAQLLFFFQKNRALL